jgi:adenosylhomocysteine nucleosidase
MSLRSLLQIWLQNMAKTRAQQAVVEAARGRRADAAEPCHWGFVFALGIESGCFEDWLRGLTTFRGHGFIARKGALAGRQVAVMLAGPGRENARRATEALLDGHRPLHVVSAGFAGGLSAALGRNDILIADQVFSADGAELPIALPAALAAAVGRPGVHRGPLATSDHVIRLPHQRQSLAERTGALAVDMETFAVAEVCAARRVAFSSVRVINDTAGETLPRDVEHLLAQKTGAARLGAALGALWRRPASAKDLYQLRENALVASLRLARFLAETLVRGPSS